jgi:hypothetical protein
MDRDKKASAEIQTLRSLCDEKVPRERRLALLRTLSQHDFLKPEHQVVFESISVLLRRGRISVTQLRVFLNNRGFPDIDVEAYFPGARTETSQENPDEAAP